MTKVNIYLNFNGTTEAAFEFYKSVFGGEFTGLMRFGDAPAGPPMPEEVVGKIMHIALPIGESVILMGTDSLEALGHTLIAGNNVLIALSPDTEDEARRLFAGLSAGGTIEVDLQRQFWGALFGSFTDKFGTKWMVNCEPPKA